MSKNIIGENRARISLDSDQDILNVKDHGVVGDGVTNDRAALNNAINAAKAAGKVVYIPAGTYYIDMSQSRGGCFHINGNLKIMGAGIGQTKLKFGPRNFPVDAPDGGIALYLANGKHLKLCDLEMEGPDILGIDEKLTCYGIFCEGNGSILTLEKVKTSKFNQAVKMGSYRLTPKRDTETETYKSGHIVAADCQLGARGVIVLHIEGNDAASQSGRYTRTKFEHDPDFITKPTPGHALYYNVGVSLLVYKCEFKNIASKGVQMYGGLRAVNPQFAIIIDSVFDNVPRSILANLAGQTLILGCQFRASNGGGILLRGGSAIVKNCTFQCLGPAAGHGIQDIRGQETELSIDGCIFENDNAVYHIRRQFDGTKLWKIKNCTFGNPNFGGANIFIEYGQAEIDDCTFNQVSGGAATVRVHGGKVWLRNNTFIGAKPVMLRSDNEATVYHIYGNIWRQNAGLPAFQAIKRITAYGADNVFEGSDSRAFGVTNPSQTIGYISPHRGLGTHYPDGNNLRFTSRADMYLLNDAGSPDYKNLNFLGPNDNNTTKVFGSAITCIIAAPCSFSNTGNIKDAPGKQAINSVITFTYDPVSGFWHERKQ